MIEVPMCKGKKPQVCDLDEGDIAVIKVEGVEMLVYLFKQSSGAPLQMVALDRPKYSWSRLDKNNLPVIKVLQKGDSLRIS